MIRFQAYRNNKKAAQAYRDKMSLKVKKTTGSASFLFNHKGVIIIRVKRKIEIGHSISIMVALVNKHTNKRKVSCCYADGPSCLKCLL